MANIQKPRHAINLLPHQGRSFADTFLNFALSIGRFIVISTEVLALGAFVYRFPLDSKLSDLHTKIKQQQVYINFFKQDEDSYRNLQDRLLLAKTLSKTEADNLQIFFFISSAIPQNIVLSSINQTSDKIIVDISLSDITSLTQFVNTIKQSPYFSAISIDKIEKQASTGTVLASISITRKQ